MRAALLAWAVVAAGALSTAHAATDAPAPSRIIDRTLLCRMTGVGYPDTVRTLTVGSATQNPTTSEFPASINVSNGAAGSGTSVQIGTGIDDQAYKSVLLYSRTTCSPSKLRVPLSRRSLRGGAVPFYAGYDCDVEARVLIRVQAIFERPPRVVRGATQGDLVYGYLAVASFPGRRPIAFASLNGKSEQTRVFVAPSRCTED